jgi:general L-amino acid transport system permease protein
VTLFSAAYMAEVVRGGLQAIPKGQYEGAMALGLTGSGR